MKRMEDEVKVVGWAFVTLVLLIVFGYGLTWLGLLGDRPVKEYQAETDKRVYDNSRSYQQGTNLDIARYCMQMKTATEPSAKRAVAQLILTTAATYEGPLSPDAESCIDDAKRY